MFFLYSLKRVHFYHVCIRAKGVKEPKCHCRGLGGPKGPPVLCNDGCNFLFYITFPTKVPTKEKYMEILLKPTLGMGEKP